MSTPSADQFLKGVEEFEKKEKRDAMYRVATFLVDHFWGKPVDMADGLGVLLLTWNQAFYRYGVFDFDKLEGCIARNIRLLDTFRSRDISSLSSIDEGHIKDLFVDFLDALQIQTGKEKGRKSPVAVAKALHMLAPSFFPLWDERIAKAYGCRYSRNPQDQYVSFCKITRDIAGELRSVSTRSDETIVKLIDEYNYSKYTKKWI
jgi:hypothetical protein